MKTTLRLVRFGVLSWAVPFVAAMFFFSPDGGLAIDKILFKSIMIVVGTFTAAALLVWYFKSVEIDYLKESIAIGFVLLLANCILDILVLLPMSGMSLGVWVAEIGLRYLAIPAMSVPVGIVAERAARS